MCKLQLSSTLLNSCRMVTTTRWRGLEPPTTQNCFWTSEAFDFTRGPKTINETYLYKVVIYKHLLFNAYVCNQRKSVIQECLVFSLNSLRPSDAYIFVVNLAIIGSDNGLSPGRRQAIIWTNDGILLIGPLGTNFSEISIEIHTFSFKKMHLKMSSG